MMIMSEFVNIKQGAHHEHDHHAHDEHLFYAKLVMQFYWLVDLLYKISMQMLNCDITEKFVH